MITGVPSDPKRGTGPRVLPSHCSQPMAQPMLNQKHACTTQVDIVININNNTNTNNNNNNTNNNITTHQHNNTTQQQHNDTTQQHNNIIILASEYMTGVPTPTSGVGSDGYSEMAGC